MAKSTRTSASKKTAAPKKQNNASSSRAKASSGNRGRATATAQKSDETMLKELFTEELKDIYYAEKLLLKALPKMSKAATSEELRDAFNEHIAVTEGQVGRLEQVFEILDLPARGKKCDAMEGLVKESQSAIEELPKGTMVRDAGLIICAQKVEHYEIAAYGSLVQLARTMSENEIADLLEETLSEEKEADQMLTELAVSGINLSAEGEMEESKGKSSEEE
jgi:ferritin-like metal-binding protein YciE